MPFSGSPPSSSRHLRARCRNGGIDLNPVSQWLTVIAANFKAIQLYLIQCSSSLYPYMSAVHSLTRRNLNLKFEIRNLHDEQKGCKYRDKGEIHDLFTLINQRMFLDYEEPKS